MGEPSTEHTEVRILFDTNYLYFGIYCYDSDSKAIVATELRYDAEMEGDDIFEIMIDTFHNHRNGYRFRVNPLGTIRDQSVTDEGLIVNDNWDEKWDARATITSEGWFAEMRIPFTAMRFPEGAQQTWGINFHRTIMRKSEDSFWSGFQRGYTLTRISGGGHLEGLEGIKGLRFRVKPYLAGSLAQHPSSNQVRSNWLGHVGIEDAKLLLTPQLALDMTVNPDFAQAEVDQAQVNLTRFNLFFPEKREFFQEGSGIFQFGTGSRFGTVTDLLLFHSRRIGLSDSREQIPIWAGMKLTGKQGPLELGLLNMQTGPKGSEPGQNFTVLRAKATPLPRSYVGVMLTRNTGSDRGGDNRAMGFDANFSFHRYLYLQGFAAKTYSRGLEEKDWASKASIEWNSDRYLASAEHFRVGENFRPEMGFVRRAEPGWNGLEQTKLEASYKPRPRWRHIRQFNFGGALDYFADQDGLLISREGRALFVTNFQSGDSIRTEFGRDFERLISPFRIRGGDGIVSRGDYRFNRFSTQYNSHPGRFVSGSVRFERSGYFDGTLTTINAAPFWKPSPNLSLQPGIAWNRIERRSSTFTTSEINTAVNYSLSQKWLTRTSFVLNSQDQSVLMNFRINYIVKPGDDLFIVYRESRNYGNTAARAGNGLVNRALILKLTYSWDM